MAGSEKQGEGKSLQVEKQGGGKSLQAEKNLHSFYQKMVNKRITGTCVWFDSARGVGAIKCDTEKADGDNIGHVSVTRAHISAENFPSLKMHERIEFMLDYEGQDKNHLGKCIATDVTLIGGDPVPGVKPPRCRWDPNLPSHHVWDIIILIIIIYNIAAVPVMIAFNIEVNICDFWGSGWLFYLNVFLDVIFMADIIVNFLTPIVEPETHQLNWELKAIAKNYAKFWLYVDVVSTIPWDLIIEVSVLIGCLLHRIYICTVCLCKRDVLSRKWDAFLKNWYLIVFVGHMC